MNTQHPTAKALAVSVLAFACILQPATSAETAAKLVKIYVLSGQSNMTGRGDLVDLRKPAEDQNAT